MEAANAASGKQSDGPTARPLEQLRVIHGELDKQRALQTARESALQTRLALLVGGAGLGMTLMARAPVGLLSILAGVLALTAAAVGVITMVALKTKGDEVAPAKLRAQLHLPETPDVYSLEHRLTQDKIAAHQDDQARLRVKSHACQIGFGLLVLSWLLAAISYL
jgi:hypothetical protein